MGEVQEQELNIIVGKSEDDMRPQSEDMLKPPNELRYRALKWWTQITFYILFILLGQSSAVLLGRLYYDKGGKSKWIASLVQVVGFPVLCPLYCTFPAEKTPADHNPSVLRSAFKAAPIYIVLGLFSAALCLLYSMGLQLLPVSTFSLICASQLAFNALFAFFINSQKFTPYIINSVILLTISSTLLVFSSSSNSTENAKDKYVIGLICTVAASAGYGLLLSLTQVAFQRVLRRESFKATLDMIVFQSLVASCAILVGFFASGDWKTVKQEMHQFKLGRLSYAMTLLWTAISWQIYSIGLIGLIIKVSSLFSNVIATFGLPIVPVLAVVVFHDTMDGIKVVAMLLAIWGFVSYAYQQYLDYPTAETGSPVVHTTGVIPVDET